MEFKFSCELFEIEFSGDPGYVEAQLQKYEPFILNVLARQDAEAAKSSAPEEKDVSVPAGRREYGSTRPARDRDRPADEGYPPGGKSSSSGGYPRDRVSTSTRDGITGAAPKPASRSSAADSPRGAGPEARVKEPPKKPEPPAAEERNPKTPPAPEFQGRRRAPRMKVEDLKKLSDEKRPRTHHDRVMVFGYYMEHDGAGSDFTVAEIKRCYSAMDMDPGLNIERVINHATRSGFVAKHDQGRTIRFKLSSKGKRYVEDGLKLT